MNPLPNRPLLANPSLAVTLPNLPSFDQHGFNGRPRKTVPDVALNGSNALAPNQSLDRGGSLPGAQILQPIEQQPDREDDEPQTAIHNNDWNSQYVRGPQMGGPPPGSQPGGPSAPAPWDGRPGDDRQEEGTISKDDDEDNDAEDAVSSEGENGKVWRNRRTLRR